MAHRSKVLSLYRHTLRLSRTWNVPSERPYIVNECRTLVQQNRNLTSPDDIGDKVLEFETRIETAIHYNIPYPRPINVIPGATGKDPQVVTPVYLHSYKYSLDAAAMRVKPNSAPVYDE